MIFFSSLAGYILAGHDVSDGGLITCLLEMAFGGLSGLKIDIVHRERKNPIEVLFSEEVGWVLEIKGDCIDKALTEFKNNNVPCFPIGVSSGSGPTAPIEISVHGNTVLESEMADLFQIWEETSYQLDKLQANAICVTKEFESLKKREGPKYRMNFELTTVPIYASLSPGMTRFWFVRI